MSLFRRPSGGNRGAAGATGSTGPAGPPGLVYEGVWSGASSYQENDVVSWDGSSYVCTSDHTNQEPPNASYWDVLSAAGIDAEDVLPFATELDDVGGGVTYVGSADPGTATSAASWRIKRITETGADISIEFADGDAFFDNVWDNRASLSYS